MWLVCLVDVPAGGPVQLSSVPISLTQKAVATCIFLTQFVVAAAPPFCCSLLSASPGFTPSSRCPLLDDQSVYHVNPRVSHYRQRFTFLSLSVRIARVCLPACPFARSVRACLISRCASPLSFCESVVPALACLCTSSSFADDALVLSSVLYTSTPANS